MKHQHRIIPGYEGGDYSEENVVILTPTQHAMWHFAEFQRKGNWRDERAWRGLAGLCSHEETVAEVLSQAGKKGGATTGRLYAERGLSEEHRKAIGDSVRGRTLTEEDKEKKRKGAHKRYSRPGALNHWEQKRQVWNERLAPYDLSDVNDRYRAAEDFGVTTNCITQHAKRLGVHIVWERR